MAFWLVEIFQTFTILINPTPIQKLTAHSKALLDFLNFSAILKVHQE